MQAAKIRYSEMSFEETPPDKDKWGCIERWEPENEQFWQESGKRIAYRNLWISIPALFCGFAVWMMWGIISVQMLNLGFPFTKDELFSLTAIAGISGATMRIPSSFFVRLAGGRNTIFLTSAMLLTPAIGTGIALQYQNCPLWVFQLLALLSGVGGGNYACSMANTSTFFPKRLQGTALGLNAGLGNFGVTVMQLLIPLLMTIGVFGSLGGEPMILTKDSGWLFGKIPAGTPTWVQNSGLVWVVFLVPLLAAVWFGMNNLRTASPDIGSPTGAFLRIIWLYTLGFIPSIIGLYLYLPAPTGLGVLNAWVLMLLSIGSMLLTIRLAAFGSMKASVTRQFAIFSNKHTWAMTAFYVLTFGSFIGFSMALPLSITVIFGDQHLFDTGSNIWQHIKNPNAPSALTYAWIGPFVGSISRPIGGWIADKTGGAIVTQVISAVLVIASIAAGYVMFLAYRSATPEEYFALFMLLFIVLFAASGLGNGSTVRSIGYIFSREQVGAALGWTAAIGAYGSFIAPVVINQQIDAGTPEYSMYGFAAFYAVCLVVNWWFYLRKNAYIKNP